MNTITVKKINETALKLWSDDHGILMEISEHFTFFVDGYKYMPLFRNRMWDGKFRIFNIKNGILPYGLLLELLKFAASHKYKVVLDEQIKERDIPSKHDLLSYANSLTIMDGPHKIDPHHYQLDAFTHAISEGRSLIISPTGSGKSLIIYLMIRWYLENYDDDILIIVPTTSLVAQMEKEFANYASADDSFDASLDVHQIYSGKEKNSKSARIIVSTWQSAIHCDKSWFIKYGMIIGD